MAASPLAAHRQKAVQQIAILLDLFAGGQLLNILGERQSGGHIRLDAQRGEQFLDQLGGQQPPMLLPLPQRILHAQAIVLEFMQNRIDHLHPLGIIHAVGNLQAHPRRRAAKGGVGGCVNAGHGLGHPFHQRRHALYRVVGDSLLISRRIAICPIEGPWQTLPP